MSIVRSFWGLSLPLILALGSGAPVLAAEPVQIRTLAVTGKGSTAIAANLTQVRLAIEVSGKNPTTVQKQAADRSAKVINVLKARQVDKLQTTNLSLSPVYSYENNRQILTGYMANNSLSFRVATTAAGPIIDEAVAAGATRIDSISSIIAQAQTTAIQNATQDAQRQAQAVLTSLGLQQKEIIGIQVNDAARPAPVYMAAEALNQRVTKAVPTAPTEVVGGEQEVQATVTLQIRY
jgi:uncharacterized protein